MTYTKTILAFLFLASALLGAKATLAADLKLERGPYLQNPTSSSIMIIWNTNLPSDSIVRTRGGKRPRIFRGLSQTKQHAVQLKALEAATTFSYWIESRTGKVLARDIFHTAPSSDYTGKIRFAVLGDSGMGNKKQKKVGDRIPQFDPEFLIHTGDVVYPDGDPDLYDKNFFSPYKKWLSHVAVFPIVGNHDVIKPEGYLNAFFLPAKSSGSNSEFYYSFNYGPAHFIALDSETDFSSGSPQRAWLEAELARTDAMKNVWKIVFFHRPPFSNGHNGGAADVREQLVPLFEEHKIDVVFCGHEHAYERTKKLNIYNTNKHKVLYIITGGGGDDLYSKGDNHLPEISVFEKKYNFVGVNFSKTKMTIRGIDIDGKEIDKDEIKMGD